MATAKAKQWQQVCWLTEFSPGHHIINKGAIVYVYPFKQWWQSQARTPKPVRNLQIKAAHERRKAEAKLLLCLFYVLRHQWRTWRARITPSISLGGLLPHPLLQARDQFIVLDYVHVASRQSYAVCSAVQRPVDYEEKPSRSCYSQRALGYFDRAPAVEVVASRVTSRRWLRSEAPDGTRATRLIAAAFPP